MFPILNYVFKLVSKRVSICSCDCVYTLKHGSLKFNIKSSDPLWTNEAVHGTRAQLVWNESRLMGRLMNRLMGERQTTARPTRGIKCQCG